MITLIVLFVLTVLAVSSGHDVMLNTIMQGNMQQYDAVFHRAELGWQQQIMADEGAVMHLSNSTITLQSTQQLISTDICGNQTKDITITAGNAFATVILNSRDIFARVPPAASCGKIPLHQIIWWHISQQG